MKDQEMSGDERLSDRELEAALRAGFQREAAPEDFALRVETRMAAQMAAQSSAAPFSAGGGKAGWRLHLPGARQQLATAAALLLAFTVPLGVRLHQQARIEQGEAAAQQVMLALRITGTQLRSIEERTSLTDSGVLPQGATR